MQLVPESHCIVTTAETEISCQRPDGSARRIPFDELKTAIIETNDSGPRGIDFWWILSGEGDAECIFPQAATGEDAAIDTLTKLPHFDDNAFMEAVTSTWNERFLCWERPPPGAYLA
jgi:hypothetical protein